MLPLTLRNAKAFLRNERVRISLITLQGRRNRGARGVTAPQIFPESIKWGFEQLLNLAEVYSAGPLRFLYLPLSLKVILLID